MVCPALPRPALLYSAMPSPAMVCWPACQRRRLRSAHACPGPLPSRRCLLPPGPRRRSSHHLLSAPCVQVRRRRLPLGAQRRVHPDERAGRAARARRQRWAAVAAGMPGLAVWGLRCCVRGRVAAAAGGVCGAATMPAAPLHGMAIPCGPSSRALAPRPAAAHGVG